MNALLAAIGPDRDWSTNPDPLAPGWPAWELETALWALPGIGRTKATKLIARKRPRLFPIFGFGRRCGPGYRASTCEPGAGGAARRRRGVASPVAVGPEGGRPPRGGLARCGCSMWSRGWTGKNRGLGDGTDQGR
ncbi:DUF6308 family protein [Rhodococcus koreensis]